ncbi:villin-1 isoform X2 [Telopea speciosissima]|uniref:villin-1 isoform X2 n=1 Tax=Telopea speciosissima TaxID=54955 RepID=UPI001CC3DC4B|nr:villin-1 isoform X2 [Telopea speciosissima]
MSLLTGAVEAAFQGAGAKTGLEIWCVDNLQLVPVPKSSHGKFFSGSAYIILNTVLLKSGLHQHDIHYWLGNDAKEADSALVSEKALELDAVLESHAVQYREAQGQETEKFLSYFKPCIIPIEGVFSSGGQFNSETYQVSLLACKGDHVVHVKEVPFSRSSLNHNDVFILDTASKIFLFSGCNSSTQERAKALEVVQYITENKHNGKCDVATIEDGKFVADPDVGEFWSLFGGYAPIPRDLPSTIQKHSEIPSVYLFWISAQGKLCQIGTDSDLLKKEMLNADKCYMLDCGTEIFVWMGRSTTITERKKSISSIEDILSSQGRSKGTHITFLTGGSETAAFRSYFDGWPQTVENLYEEGREKVAAIFKHHGYDVKELPDEDWQPYINCSGTLKVWRVNGSELYLIPTAEQNKLFTGDCYIVQYIYPGDEKDELLFYAWLGCNSVTEDRVEAISHMNAMVDSTKGAAVMAQVIEGEEPIQFYSIFETLIVFKGGMSSRYKCFISEKAITDETFGEQKVALFRIQGSGPNSMQAIQVDPPTWQPVSVREGSEPDVFWNAIGGKAEYPREKETKRYEKDPHLFTCTSTQGDFKVKEIFNFNQDDLTTEDILVLDCYSEIYVWIGRHANVRSKQEALTLGMKFLETDILVEGLSLETPIYVVSEGYEPSFFTRFFVWDSSKTRMHGNSFERKLAILKGQKQKMESPQRSSRKANDTYSSGSHPERSQSKTVSSERLRRSVSPATPVSGSNFEAARNNQFSSTTPIARELFSTTSPDHDTADGSLVSVEVEEPSSMEKASLMKVDGTEVGEELESFPYEQLKVTSNNPVTDIDVTKREAYLSHEEFQEKFGMTKKAFYVLPKWKQDKQKKSLHLF